MEQQDRKKILENIKLLMQPGVIDYHKIEPNLLKKKIFTKPMIDDIEAETTNSGRVYKLLVDLCTRGPYAFRAFLDILHETKQIEALNILSPNLEINSIMNVNNEVDTYRGTSIAELAATQLSTVKLATEWIQDEKCYEMSSSPRGLCLIINNEDFYNIKKKREGSQQDMKMAIKVFEDLGYEIQAELNLSAFDMESKIVEFSEREEHLYLHSCVVIIMSHGDKGIVYGSDCESVYLDSIYYQFNNKNSPNLIGKPKMLFIQACRGDDFDSGVSIPNIPNFRPVRKDGPTPLPQSYTIPTWTDMLISCSTIEGYVSNRHETIGTWYIQTLLDVLMRKAWNTDLYTILQEVGELVGEITNEHGEKQSPELIQRGFNKKLYFNPGLEK